MYLTSHFVSFRFFLIVVVLLFAVVPACLANDNVLQFIGGNQHVLQLDDDAVELAFAFELAPRVSLESLEIKVARVSIDNRVASSDWSKAFTVELLQGSTTGLPSLNITIDPEKPLLQGTYTLVLHVQYTDEEGQTIVHLDTLYLLVQPAQLAAIPTEKIKNNNTLSGEGIITLRETSGVTYLQGVTITEKRLETSDGYDNIEGKLVFDDLASIRVPVGEALDVMYRLDGEFPLGTVTGEFEIDAPQLNAPVAFMVEIETRRGISTLLGCLGLGLLVSYLTKVFLANAVATGEARVKAYELLKQLSDLHSERHDASFRQQVEGISIKLGNHLDGRNAGQIPTAINEANEALVALQADLDRRMASQKANVAELQRVLQPRWNVPAAIEPLLNQAWNELEAAIDLLSVWDATGAESIIRTTLTETGERIKEQATVYHHSGSEIVARLNAGSRTVFLPATSGAGSLKNALSTLQAALLAYLSTTSSLEMMLQSIQGVQNEGRTFVEKLHIGLQLVRRDMQRMMEGLELVKKGIFTAFMEDLEGLITQLGETIRVGSAASVAVLVGFPERLELLYDRFTEALTHETWELTVRQKETITNALKKRQYDEAVKLLRQYRAAASLPARSRDASKVQNATPYEAASENHSRGDVLLSGSRSEPIGMREGRLVTTVQQGKMPFESMASRSVQRIAELKLVQTLIMGSIILVAGYVTLLKNFVGTPVDLFGAFLWTYIFDFTGDTLLHRIAPFLPKSNAAKKATSV